MHFSIVGTGRCGSTLLQEMLDLHPDVYVFPETHWIPKMYEFFGDAPGPVSDLLSIVGRTLHADGAATVELDLDALAASLEGRDAMTVSAFCDHVGRWTAGQHGKRLWADKTPDYGPHMGLLHHLWPACRFVHIVRHGGAVADSMSRHEGYEWLAAAHETWWTGPSFNGYFRATPWRDAPLEAFVDLWSRRLVRIRDEAHRLPRGVYEELRYEDLVDRPESTLRQLCGFVDLRAPGEWLAAAAACVRPGAVASRASSEVLAKFGDRERRLLEELGYSTVADGPPRPSSGAIARSSQRTRRELKRLLGVTVRAPRPWR